jgi:hypothetical protein
MRHAVLGIVLATTAVPVLAASTAELLRCQTALHGAGRTFTKNAQTLLTNCALKVETCLFRQELDGADPTACLAAVQATCQTYSAKILASALAYRNKSIKICAPVPLGDAEAYVAGLGFFHESAACGATDPTELVGCVFDRAQCAAERLVFVMDPRAQAALTAAGVAASHPCVAP